MRRTHAWILLLAFLVAACGGSAPPRSVAPDPTETLSTCEVAVAAAAAIPAMSDTVSDLDPAIRACGSIDELQAAVDRFPDALDGVAAAVFVGNRCLYEPSLASTAICSSMR